MVLYRIFSFKFSFSLSIECIIVYGAWYSERHWANLLRRDHRRYRRKERLYRHWCLLIHRAIKKFSELSISIDRNDISSISLQRIFEVVVVIFHGKFHPFNSLLRYPFEVNNGYWIDPVGDYPCYIVVAGDYLLYLGWISTTQSPEV